ncbi:hypothetical protein M408DRAFT_300668 [Serendipita vermifera MAFF 305830]|uniref:Uncharacterized protein n=1 Tax=Serendipita vermifera MAFF 305830 TaxID=933852 RepID=A0A0C2W5S8_SERVB|nr:hypothetical protein M408DRAFT_300668 [Serendipita vermifera MAFF 305830]
MINPTLIPHITCYTSGGKNKKLNLLTSVISAHRYSLSLHTPIYSSPVLFVPPLPPHIQPFLHHLVPTIYAFRAYRPATNGSSAYRCSPSLLLHFRRNTLHLHSICDPPCMYRYPRRSKFTKNRPSIPLSFV